MPKHIYFSGIGGSGLAPLAMLARDAGYMVSGSDQQPSPNLDLLKRQGIKVSVGQSRQQFQSRLLEGPTIDWFVGTAALPPDHPELVEATKAGIKVTKRDELLKHILQTKQLQMLAVSGTHGKTTTTGMLVWLFKQLGIPISYCVGTNLSFCPSAAYTPNSQYFVYEADEFDRNMLQFRPLLSGIPSLDYDHPDTYPKVSDYKAAFVQFIEQSSLTLLYEDTASYLGVSKKVKLLNTSDPNLKTIKLAGAHNRRNGWLAASMLLQLEPSKSPTALAKILSQFPGTERRMQMLAPNLYSDYAHHPQEIASTIQLAKELSPSIVVVYQPHQNVRQHLIKDEYKNCFSGASKVYWLPTYLSREYKDLTVLKPAELISHLTQPELAQPAQMDDALWYKIQQHLKQGQLVVVMGAGSVDSWLHQQIAN